MPAAAEVAAAPEFAPGRIHGGGPVAIVDIGSNSVRLVVYEHLGRAATPLFNEKELCGLARGLATRGRLDPGAIASALAALRRFRALATQMQVESVHVLATAAPREAANGREFIASVEQIMGVPVSLLSGAEEARLSALGVISGIHNPDGIAGDLGGGSLEVIDIRKGEIGTGETFPLGGLRLEEASEKQLKKAEKIVAESLAGSKALPSGEKRPFYAIGGTWRSLARLHMRQKGYPLHVMHQYSIPAGEAADFCRMVARREIESLELDRGRLAQPLAAASLRRRGPRPGDQGHAPVRDRHVGARRARGHALRPPAGRGEGARSADRRLRGARLSALALAAPRRASCRRGRRRRSPRSGSMRPREEARLRHAACLLADIGWRAHPEYRGEQSLNLIAHAAFIGIDHPGRAYLALANFYRHEGLIDEALSPHIRELASTRIKERARALGATLRVAYLISAAMPGVVSRTRVEARGKALTLVLPADLAPLGGSRVDRRLGQLAKLAGMEPAIVGGVGPSG